MTPERLAECRECRAIVTQLLAVEPAGRCPDHGFVTLHDAQHAHVRDLEAQLAAARADVQTERNLFLRAQERVVILKAEVNEARDLICGITDTLEPYEGRLRVRGGWAKEFWGCIAEAEEYTRATTTPPSPEVGE